MNVSVFDDKDSDAFDERTVTERELSSRQAESPSDGAESTISYISIKNHAALLQANHDYGAEGQITSDGDVKLNTRKGKSREIMRRNKYRGWYELPETSDDEPKQSAKSTRKKNLEKRRSELRERSRKKRNTAASAAGKKGKEIERKPKRKAKRKRAVRKESILIVEHREEKVNDDHSSGESLRPVESSLSIRYIESRCEAYFESDSSSRTSVHPNSESSYDSQENRKTRRKKEKEELKSDEQEEDIKGSKNRGKKRENKKNEDSEDKRNSERKKDDKEHENNKDSEEHKDNREHKNGKEHEDNEEREDVKERKDSEANEDGGEHEDSEEHENSEKPELSDKKRSKVRAIEREASDVSHTTRTSHSSKSTRTPSSSSRQPSSKWAYKTTNFDRRRSSSGFSEVSRRRVSLVAPKKQAMSKKKYKELPVLRGIPRVMRRVKTETLLVAGKLKKYFEIVDISR